MRQQEGPKKGVAMAEAAGKEETTPGTLKEKAEESEGWLCPLMFVDKKSSVATVRVRVQIFFCSCFRPRPP